MIVLTGATGTIGQSLAEQLSKTGTKFRVVARNPEKAKKDPNIEVVKGSFDDSASLEAAFKGATKVFNLSTSVAEMPGWSKNIVDAAKKNGVKHMVRLSVPGADPKSPIKIAQWHAEADAYLKASGLQSTFLLPMFFMQNFLGSAATIKKDGAFYGCGKDGKIAAIDARDIAGVGVKTLTTDGHAGKSYVLTGDQPASHAEIAQKLSKVTGKTVKYVDLPPEQFKAGLVSAGIPDGYAADLVTMHQYISQGGMSKVDPTVGQLLGKYRSWDDFFATYGSAFK